MPQGLKEGTFYMLLGFGGSMLANFGAQVVASRTLGPETYGLYGLVVFNAALISGFFDPGLSTAMATFVTEKEVQRDRRGISSIIKGGISIEIILAILLMFMYLPFNKFVTDKFFSGIPFLVLFLVVIVIMQGFYGMFLGAIIGFRELKYVSLVRFVQQASLFILMFCFLKGLSLGLAGALSIHTLSIFLGFCLTVVFVQRSMRKYEREDKHENKNNCSRLKDNMTMILKFAVPVSLAAILTSWIQSSGPAITNYLSNNNPGRQLGNFVILLTLCRFFDNIIKIMTRSAFPYLVSWNIEGNRARTKQFLKIMILFVLAGYILLIVGAFYGGRDMIYLVFGGNYLGAAEYLPVALLAFCGFSICNVYKISLYSMKSPGLFLIINAVGMSLFLLSLVSGQCLFHIKDPIYLVFICMGLANASIALASWVLFNDKLKHPQELSRSSFPL